MPTIWVIIRTGKIDNHYIESDLEFLKEEYSEDIEICIPSVRLLKYQLHTKKVFYTKALLFNYGFIRIPVYMAYNQSLLAEIVSNTRSVAGFVYRRKSDLHHERLVLSKDYIRDEPEGTEPPEVSSDIIKQVIVEQVDTKEVARLNELTRGMDVYNTTDELSIGSYILLKGYPFANMVAKVLSKAKSSIRVSLLDTGVTVTVQSNNIYYSPYEEEPSREICFTELGYVPDVGDGQNI